MTRSTASALAAWALLAAGTSPSSSAGAAFAFAPRPTIGASSSPVRRGGSSGRSSGTGTSSASRLASLSDAVASAVSGVVGAGSLDNVPLSDLAAAALTVDPATLSASAGLDDISSSLLSSPWHTAAIGAFGVGGALNLAVNAKETEAPYEPGTSTYDPEAADEFFSKRPLLVLGRVLKLAFLTGAFNTGLLFDWLVLGKLAGDEEYTALRKAEPWRAKVALELCEKLGPTFIKLGQALSIRTDLLPEAYALELRKLQDAVPPFPSDKAREVLRKELGVAGLSEVFASLSDEPVASASIGQVYRGTLVTGEDVAVKVQRPGILAEIALDLHVLRLLTPFQTTFQNLANGVKTTQDDIDTALLLVDEWGRGFVAETDYRLEAENTANFEAAMRSRGLDAVCAPTVLEEYARDKVLLTEWVEGTRLDRDASPDVPRLCGVAINAYLTMLLDTGVLHCDPHPGNLLRTTDGKLCILDWGMTLSVPDDLQYALLEFIAHINTENYDAIPQDFINLGFSPDGVSAQKLKDSGITEGLSFTFRQLSAGGGPKKIQERVKAEFQERYGADLSDEELRKAARAEMMERMEDQLAKEGVDVKGVTNIMEEMSRRNRELFALPPYVLYVARAFSTLEGIGLGIDENYAIVQECYPYLSRRLFTDRSPRAKRALRAMLGLAEEAEGTTTVGGAAASSTTSLDVVRASTLASVAGTSSPAAAAAPGAISPGKLLEMSDGFASYTAATADVDRDGAGQAAAADAFLELFLDPKGSTLQDILVDETARLGDAATRSALKAALVDSVVARAAAAALRAPKDALENSPVAAALPEAVKKALVDRPAALPDLVERLVTPDEEDERVLATARELGDALGPRIASAVNGGGGGGSSRDADDESSNNDGLRSALAGQLADGAAGVPNLPNLPDVAETRRAVADRLPGVAALGRRVGAGLLRRAAYRADRAAQGGMLSERTRSILVDANTALADVLEPTSESESESAGSEKKDE